MATQAKPTTTPKTVPVTVENFVRAETDAYFKKYATGPGRELGKTMFRRDVSPVDDQTIVRQNRDTLYGAAVFDLDAGPVTITLPDPRGHFMSMQTLERGSAHAGRQIQRRVIQADKRRRGITLRSCGFSDSRQFE